jgi:hypothetical protein
MLLVMVRDGKVKEKSVVFFDIPLLANLVIMKLNLDMTT